MKLSPYEKESFDFNDYTFLESKSYEKPDDYYDDYDEEEEEEEKSRKEKFQSFAYDNSPKGLLKKGLIIFVILTYLVWMSAQYLVSLNTDITISVLPHRIIYNLLSTNPMLAFITALLMVILSGVIVFALSQKTEKERELYKMSQRGTYGSASFATDEDMRGSIIFHQLDMPKGIVLGKRSNVKLGQQMQGAKLMSDEAYTNMQQELAVCVDSSYLDRNMNFAIFGSSGSGKSFSFVRPNILARIANGESFFVTDPSGELYRDTAGIAEKNGYKVMVLNLSTPSASNGWNPFDVLRAANPMEVQMLTASLVHTILSNTADENAKADVFFDQSEENLLKALILYVAISPHFKGEEYERHMGTVYDLLTKCAAQEGILEEFAPQNLPDSDPAAAPWKMFQGSGRLKTNFITGLASRLEIFQVDIIKEMFSHSEINLSAAGQEKCAYYVVSPVTNNKMRFLLSLFFSCAFEQLITDATNSGGKTKIPVYFLMDEFKAIGRINGFSDKVANVRKYGISIAMVFQDLDQLLQLYPKDFNSILSNCDTWMCLKVNDMETAKKLSERSGISTIEVQQVSIQRMKMTPIDPIDPMQRIGVSDQKRNLINPDEIIRYFDDKGTNDRKVLIFSSSKNPYKAKAYGWPNHQLAKYVQENQREVSDYIPPWQKEEWTLNKKRTFVGSDINNSSELYGGKSLERDEYKERARQRDDRPFQSERKEQRKEPETYKEKATKKPGGVVFNSNAESTHLVELGLDLSGKKKV